MWVLVPFFGLKRLWMHGLQTTVVSCWRWVADASQETPGGEGAAPKQAQVVNQHQRSRIGSHDEGQSLIAHGGLGCGFGYGYGLERRCGSRGVPGEWVTGSGGGSVLAVGIERFSQGWTGDGVVLAHHPEAAAVHLQRLDPLEGQGTLQNGALLGVQPL